MGRLFEFTCEGCGYRAEASGRRDFGALLETRTMMCRHCRRIVDVAFAPSPGSPDYGKPANPDRFGHCPRCGCRDVVPWSRRRPCPKCGTRMTKGQLTVLWD